MLLLTLMPKNIEEIEKQIRNKQYDIVCEIFIPFHITSL